jgi:hypothetical protein
VNISKNGMIPLVLVGLFIAMLLAFMAKGNMLLKLRYCGCAYIYILGIRPGCSINKCAISLIIGEIKYV